MEALAVAEINPAIREGFRNRLTLDLVPCAITNVSYQNRLRQDPGPYCHVKGAAVHPIAGPSEVSNDQLRLRLLRLTLLLDKP